MLRYTPEAYDSVAIPDKPNHYVGADFKVTGTTYEVYRADAPYGSANTEILFTSTNWEEVENFINSL